MNWRDLGQKLPFLSARTASSPGDSPNAAPGFVQLYHTNWDSHGGPGENLNTDFEKVCKDVDQASAALVLVLNEHGMLEDTPVILGQRIEVR
jgi:hypothetical protein